MVVMNSPKVSDQTSCLSYVQQLLDVQLESSDKFCWSPKSNTISYIANDLNNTTGQWSLLHEAAHAKLNHQNYKTDFELLKLEVAAWKEASLLAMNLNMPIDEGYMQDCLDTYRDWLHQRSTCPTCGNAGLQHSSIKYQCHNCFTNWTVSESRFCRPYRRKRNDSKQEKSPSSTKNQTTFR